MYKISKQVIKSKQLLKEVTVVPVVALPFETLLVIAAVPSLKPYVPVR